MNRYIALQKVVELGSFTKAAEILGYTQPAMSQMIASLEKELSIKLLYRSRYGIHLTLEGERLYPMIQETVARYKSMLGIAKEIRGLESGTIRIGTGTSISCHWLPRLISGFQELYPNVQFVLHQGDYRAIAEWVRIGEVDCGILNPDGVPGVKVRFIKAGEHRAILPPSHPLAKNRDVTLEELAREPFLLMEEGGVSTPLNAFKQAGLEPHIRVSAHDDYSILAMVELGLGVSILPELVLRKIDYDVAILPLRPVLPRSMGLIRREDNSTPVASRKFIDYLFAHIDELP